MLWRMALFMTVATLLLEQVRTGHFATGAVTHPMRSEYRRRLSHVEAHLAERLAWIGRAFVVLATMPSAALLSAALLSAALLNGRIVDSKGREHC